MASNDIETVTKQLETTKVDTTSEICFKGKGLKLDKPDDAKEIIEAIEQCETMTALRLEGNTLGIEAAEAIAQALKKHPEFKRALWSDMFTGRLKTEIPTALKHLGAAMIEARAQLVELDLSDNAFGPNGVNGIVDLLKSETCYTLKELRLNNNGLGPTGGKMLASCLMDCYQSSSAAGNPLALQVFISGRGRLENEGSKALSEVFKLMGSLEEVAMPQNGINHEGISALAEAFAHNPRLRILNLNDNTFTEVGAKAMAKVLPKLQNLEVINFGDCLLKTGGAKAIAKAISRGHTKLRELVLSGNEIGKAGANAVAEAMENKECLARIDMDSNQLGEEGIEMFRASLEGIDKGDTLGSLSNDEGSDEDEEDDYDEDNEEVTPEEAEGEHVDDPELQVRGKALSPSQTMSIQDFLSFPSPTKLHSIGRNLKSMVRQELNASAGDMDKIVSTLIRISTVLTETDTKAHQIVCECADDVLQQVLQPQNDNSGVELANAYLVYMGILKGEDKKYRPPSDITGPLILLEHVVKQKYFPRQAKKIFSAFMDKPHPLLSKSVAIRSKLMQSLYS